MSSPESRVLFVTGATGFVGGALLLRLLRDNPGDRAFCLVRADDDRAAAARLRGIIDHAADVYGYPADVASTIAEQAVAIRGDLTGPALGLSERDRARMASAGPLTVWHAAASLKDDEPSLREIIAHNVTGTERVLETLLRFDVAVFNHISTAYVAGRRGGDVPESLERPRGFSNRYEQTKHYGEQLVVDHCRNAGVPFRILRPGVVISHSGTGAATGYNGFMGWILKVAALNDITGGSLEREPLRYLARGDTEVNVIPIDSVVEDCAGIDAARDATHDRVFHLTNNGCAPTVQWLCDITARTLRLAPIECVEDEARLDPVSARFHRWTRFERAYNRIQRRFRRDNDRLYRSPRHGVCPISPDLMERMIHLAVHDMRKKSTAHREEVA